MIYTILLLKKEKKLQMINMKMILLFISLNDVIILNRYVGIKGREK